MEQYWHNVKGFVIIAVAIDNLMISVINDNIICEIKEDLMKIFKVKDFGELHWLLNLKIKWNRNSKSISFSQKAYIDKILSWFNLEDSKMHTTPIEPNIQLSKDQRSSTDQRKGHNVKDSLQGGNRITHVGCSSHMTWYCFHSITTLSTSWESRRNILESSEKSHGVS